MGTGNDSDAQIAASVDERDYAYALGHIPEMVETIRSGGSLSWYSGSKVSRLHLAVVRYVNELGAGDVAVEYEAVVEAMRNV